MKHMCFIHVLIAGVILIFGSIKNVNAQKIVNFEMDDFEEIIELKGEKLNLENPLMDPRGIILTDTLLFVRDNSSPAVVVISLNSGKIISKFCRRGRGPGELIAPFGFQYIKDENEFMIEDAVGQKIVFYDLDLVLADAPRKSTKSVNFQDTIRVHRVVKLKDDNLFCNLIGHKDGYMNCILSPEGEFVKYLDKYPKIKLPFNTDYGVHTNIF